METVATLEVRIKQINEGLWSATRKHISSSPDPHPLTVKNTYEERWSPLLAWNRLLNELEALSVLSKDAQFLEELQEETLGTRPHLRDLVE